MANRLAEQLKSDVADMKNTGERWGGALTAGLVISITLAAGGYGFRLFGAEMFRATGRINAHVPGVDPEIAIANKAIDPNRLNWADTASDSSGAAHRPHSAVGQRPWRFQTAGEERG